MDCAYSPFPSYNFGSFSDFCSPKTFASPKSTFGGLHLRSFYFQSQQAEEGLGARFIFVTCGTSSASGPSRSSRRNYIHSIVQWSPFLGAKVWEPLAMVRQLAGAKAVWV